MKVLHCLFLALLPAASLHGQLMPDAPVENFRLFGFDDETGYRVWHLEGSRGAVLGEGHLEVQMMRLQWYIPTEEQTVRLRIESPLAEMFPREMRAEGESGLAVTGAEFFITGENWIWLGQEQNLRIFKNARVVFRQDLGSLIK